MPAAPSTKIACPKCSALNPEVARFCNNCGVALEGTSVPPAAPKAPPAHRVPGKKMCPGCAKVNEGSAAFCFDCGVRLPERSVGSAVGNPAGFFIRLMALTIDLVLAAVAVYFVAQVFSGGNRQSIARFDHLTDDQAMVLGVVILVMLMIFIVLLFVANFVISALMIAATGRTVGKLLFGLRVVRADGSDAKYGDNLLRLLAYALSAIPLGLGFLWVPLSSHGRGWHDYISGTRVIKVQR